MINQLQIWIEEVRKVFTVEHLKWMIKENEMLKELLEKRIKVNGTENNE